jgi:anti-sigma B factor antagonist
MSGWSSAWTRNKRNLVAEQFPPNIGNPKAGNLNGSNLNDGAIIPVQTDTKAKIDQVTSPAGTTATVLRFEGDISSASKDAVIGSYQGLSKTTVKTVLLDFTKVEYINSSGIALVIQVLMEAANAGQKVLAFGLSAHFQKVFTMVGITKYAGLFPDQNAALATV